MSSITQVLLALGGAIAGPTTLSYSSFTEAATETITAPATVGVGELFVLYDYAANGAGVPTTVVPTGFVSIHNSTVSTRRFILSYKITDGTEDSATITGMLGDSAIRKHLYHFTADSAISSVTVSTPVSEITSGNPVAQTIAASSGNVPLVAIAACRQAATAAFTTFSPAADATNLASNSQHITGYKIYNSSPSDISVDVGDTGADNYLTTFYIEVA